MKKLALWLLGAVVLLLALVLYRSRTRLHLNVEPHAREVIEKAMQR
jgi:hypothetical protein